jgi:hypothetical protein
MSFYGSGDFTERAATGAAKATDVVARPDGCPSCQSRTIDTLAKVITVNTTWRCRGCEHTWSISAPNSASGHRR